MINTTIFLVNFRNHRQSEVKWGECINIITGPNGAGKTSLIDAIHYLCMGRSFTSSSDQYVVGQGAESFFVKGTFQGNIRDHFEIACSYERREGKKLWVNESPLNRHAELIGMVPVILVSSEDRKLTGEGPSERRSFIDALISQTSSTYLQDLIWYRRIIRQRNRLLNDYCNHPDQLSVMLEPWNKQLIETGSRIVVKRFGIISAFQSYLEKAHRNLTASLLKPSIKYKTFCSDVLNKGFSEHKVGTNNNKPSEGDENNIIYETFAMALSGSSEKERERHQTVIGPHRDELIFYLNDMELRKFGSQGQHRIFALALKMAQLYFYCDALEDLPVFLLDDAFGELDPQKTDIVMNMLLSHPGQAFITAAHPDKISATIPVNDKRIRQHEVFNGVVRTIE